MNPTLALTLALALCTAWSEASGAVRSQPLTLNFGGTPSGAELLQPDDGKAAPLVLLIQGTGPEDRNGSFLTPGGMVQGSMGDLAQALARQGFAVMRYDKRHAAQALNPATFQAAQEGYARLRMTDLLGDARTALQVALKQPGINGGQVFVYGWSEGSVVAAALAQEIGAQGLIVQGPVVDSFAATFANQFSTVGLAYLTPYAREGLIDLGGVLKALMGPGSALAKTQAALLLDRTSTPAQPKLATLLDSNQDGQLDLKREVEPQLLGFYEAFMAASPMYAPETTLPTLGTLAPKLRMPLLIVQGEHDGNVSAHFARQLNEALRVAQGRPTLKLYPGLGHSLGPASGITQDNFAPMALEPMNDIATWLKAQLR
ncbi:alpha/beta hydrolase [Deinococcus sp. HMF7604]|uniref:alpha/beta hydrolase family protein n=1 Tax=Deinococcus betulae TaxID=2873312 RepID=UPI001CD0173D|nr:alpha/beta fold hydrolase [Deinococcus betulae]MBZ9750168.1 alpha/beta hydrolase [Deinococcus betulae]